MAVKFENYTHSFKLKQKPVFAPTENGYRIGRDVKARVEGAYTFDPYFYHLQSGGHVAALHAHRQNVYFCKVDIENFFYSIARNRITRWLKETGIKRPVHYAKWSCVKSPYGCPAYALPYGFVQSPILATLVLAKSELGQFLREIAHDTTVAVYVDDISISGNNISVLRDAYSRLLDAAKRASFELNARKSVKPCNALEVFNCTLRQGHTAVTQGRVSMFYEGERSATSVDGFARYCLSVSEGNV